MSTAAVTSDPWAQYAGKPQSAHGDDPWEQYAEKSRSVQSPIPPPAVHAPRLDMHPSFLIGDPNADATPQDPVEGAVRNLYQVSAPGIVTSIANRKFPSVARALPDVMTRNAAPLEKVPGLAVTNFALMGEGGEGESAPVASEAPLRPRPVAPAAESAPGMMSRAAEVAIRRAGRIPGVQAAKDALYIARGEPAAEVAAPSPAPAPIPETEGIPWGSGGPGPLSLRGKLIPQTPVYPGANLPEHPGEFPGANLPETPPGEVLKARGLAEGSVSGQPLPGEALGRIRAPHSEPAPIPITQKSVTSALENSLGAEPLKPDVPLRNQMTPRAEPVSQSKAESSVIQDHTYDPQARELHVTTKTNPNIVYVYGDVDPEGAALFDKGSKGKAWKQFKDTNAGTLVAKIVNGERIPVRPVIRPGDMGAGNVRVLRNPAPTENEVLVPQLRDSLRNALARRQPKSQPAPPR